jgi:hypothetical protein
LSNSKNQQVILILKNALPVEESSMSRHMKNM